MAKCNDATSSAAHITSAAAHITSAAAHISVTTASAMELARSIRTGVVTSRRVVDAHIAVLRAGHDLGAIAANRFTQAQDEADAADRLIGTSSADDDLPPLLGVPFTVKEAIPVAGMPFTAGMQTRRGTISTTDARAVDRLKAAGAIVVGVTNTSELCLGIESYNSVYGRTRNPYDPRRTAGGSSGGEGAAVGSGGVPFGLGADTGGSIRLPAFFCGVFGHKPSPGLVPSSEQIPSLTAHAGTEVDAMESIGPLARRAEDLMPLLRILSESDLPTTESVNLEGLSVIIPEGTTYFRPLSPELKSAQDSAAQALSEVGANVQRVQLTALRRSAQFYLIALREHAGTSVSNLFDFFGETPTQSRRPSWSRTGSLQMTLTIIGDKLPELLPSSARRKITDAGEALAAEVQAAMGDGVILHPAFPRTAPLHNGTLARPWLFGGAAIFNLLGLPVTQVPLGLDTRGLPLGIQVAGAAGNDHVTIRVALELERAMGGWRPPGQA
ncbi:amidase [Rhodococcus sp. IEGM 1379]|uniref:amidase n=1 Tax=Rhodococcus sp. IEGM 1379 TaxID=3047086 RepID=UPI0024B819C8|nr:amidase [Rhodococcus sp. IEGM 1379]MDI9917894.1 amidase [Rhodococcus sp. IEGM 1379]